MTARCAGPTLGAVLLAGALAADSPSIPASTVVVVVNGEQVSALELRAAVARLQATGGLPSDSEPDIERVMDRVVNDVLITQEARALGLHEEAPIPETLETNRRRLTAGWLERVEVDARAEPEAQAVEILFEEMYRTATFHVLTAYEKQAAEDIRKALDEGADIEALAKERSVDPYRLRGGLVQAVVKKDLQPDIADVVFALEPGELAGPIRTDLGWSVLRLDSIGQADRDRLQAVRPTLEALARQRKGAVLRAELVRDIATRVPVMIDNDLVGSIVPARAFDGRLAAPVSDPDAVVVRIGEREVVTAEEYGKALERRWREMRNEEAARAAAPLILETLVSSRLLLEEGRARGFDREPRIVAALWALENQLLVAEYLNEVVAPGVEVTDEDKRAHYAEHASEYRQTPRVRLGQITVASREEADEVAGLLRAGSDLAWLARQRSLDEVRETGGVREWIDVQPGTDPFTVELLQAQVGDVLGPVPSDGSWVVVKLLGREERGLYPFEQVSGNVREAVYSERFRLAIDRLLEKLRERSEIEIHWNVVEKLAAAGAFRPRAEAEEETHAAH